MEELLKGQCGGDIKIQLELNTCRKETRSWNMECEAVCLWETSHPCGFCLAHPPESVSFSSIALSTSSVHGDCYMVINNGNNFCNNAEIFNPVRQLLVLEEKWAIKYPQCCQFPEKWFWRQWVSCWRPSQISGIGYPAAVACAANVLVSDLAPLYEQRVYGWCGMC